MTLHYKPFITSVTSVSPPISPELQKGMVMWHSYSPSHSSDHQTSFFVLPSVLFPDKVLLTGEYLWANRCFVSGFGGRPCKHFTFYVSFLLLNCKTYLRWRLRGAMKTMILLSEWDWVRQDNKQNNEPKQGQCLHNRADGIGNRWGCCGRGVFIASRIRGNGLPDDQEVYSP